MKRLPNPNEIDFMERIRMIEHQLEKEIMVRCNAERELCDLRGRFSKLYRDYLALDYQLKKFLEK